MLRIGRRDLSSVALYDILPALAVAVVMSVDIFQWTGSQPPTNAQRLSYVAVSVLAVTGMLLRRRAPLVVLVAVVLIYKLWVYLFFPPGVQIPFSPVLIVPILAYNTGAHTRGRQAFVGAAVLAAFIAWSMWTMVQGHPTGNELTFGAVLTVAWLIGKGMQRYRDLTNSLRVQARQLEQERDERAKLAVALERARIARELHDVIAHSVSVMVVQASAEKKVLGKELHQTREVLEMIERTGRQALVELRRMLGVLRKTDDSRQLAPQPGMPDLINLLDQVREAGLHVGFHVEGSRVPVPAGVGLSAYRIVQEALTNTLKHAGATHVDITLRYFGDHLDLVVADDGRGASDGVRSNGGHGLVGMRERVAMLGGSLQAGPKDGGGFLVSVTLPLETAST